MVRNSQQLSAKVERTDEGTFENKSISWWANKLRVKYHALYDACKRCGLAEIANDRDLIRALYVLQARSVPFSMLADVFGPNTSLFELAREEVMP